MSNTAYIEKIVKGAFLVLVSMILGKLFSYLYVILVATKLGSHEYGILSIGMAILSFLNAFSLLGLDEGVIRFVSYFRGKNDLDSAKETIYKSFKKVLNTSIFLSILLIVFSDFISDKVFNEYKLSQVLFFMALTLPLTSTAQIFLSSFRAFQKPVYEVSIKEVLEKSSRLIITVVLIGFGFKLVGALLGFFLAALIMFLVVLSVFNVKILNIFAKETISKISNKELLNYSLPLLLKNFMWFIIAWTDLLMIGYFKTTSDVGIYNVALPTANLIIIPVYGIMYLFFPIINELGGAGNLEEIKNIYKRISKYILLVTLPLFLIISVLSQDIIRLLFGEEYIKAVIPLIILSFGYFIYSLSDISMNILSSLNKTKTIFGVIAFFAICNGIMNYFLIQTYGLIGAAISTSISFIIGGVLMIKVSHKYSKMHPFMFKYKKILVAFLITSIMAILIKRYMGFSPVLNIIIFIILISIVYITLLFKLKIIENEDIELIKNLKKY